MSDIFKVFKLSKTKSIGFIKEDSKWVIVSFDGKEAIVLKDSDKESDYIGCLKSILGFGFDMNESLSDPSKNSVQAMRNAWKNYTWNSDSNSLQA